MANEKDNEPFIDEEDNETQIVEHKTPEIKRGKKGATIIDQYGGKEKKKRSIDMGLSTIVLPPIMRKRMAIYRIKDADKINPATGLPAEKQDVTFPGTYSFYDKGNPDLTKRTILMRNIIRQEMVIDKDGRQVLEDVIDPIVFRAGVLQFDIEANYRLYVFLELHPWNESNKFRPMGGETIFERTDIKTNKSLAFKFAEEEMQTDAINIVRDMKDRNIIIGYATSAGIPTMENGATRDIPSIKSDLRAIAMKDPRKFLSLSNNTRASVRINILDALSLGFIEYEPDKKRFIDPDGDTGDEILHVHLPGIDPNESLIDWMSDPKNLQLYDAILNKLDYWHDDGK